jgi:uncharacterized glyoxalase superfamily protein PhnB
LGLTVPDAGSDDYVETKLENGLRISWNKAEMMREIYPDWEEPRGHRLGLAFLCGSPAGVDEVHDRIVQAGFLSKKAPWDAFWGQRYALVEEPDGNIVDLFAPLA